MADADDTSAAEATAMRVLAGASQSADGLQRRLMRHGFSGEQAVQRCRELGYVDDAALATSVVSRHRRRHHGRARVIADLRGRGIDRATIERATAELEASELEAAIEAAKLLKARSERRLAASQQERQRLAAALQRRGFSAGVIGEALRSLD
jgi:SOS response regulatory protein OraA/RecX